MADCSMPTRQRGRRGQALVAFALVIVLCLGTLMAMFEGTRLVASYVALSNAAREGARAGLYAPTTELSSAEGELATARATGAREALQWNLRQVHAPEAWRFGAGRADIVVAIIDSGIDGEHPDLIGELVSGSNLRERGADTRDEVGHGTQVAGIIAALGNNDLGVAGLARGVRLMPLKITNRNGDASSATAADAVRWATDQGARIVNLSFGSLRDAAALRQAVDEARRRGVLLVAAAGNCGDATTYREHGCAHQDQSHYPAAFPEVVAVGALGATGEAASYSTKGAYVRLTAPGGVGGPSRSSPSYILSTTPTRQPGATGQPGYDYDFGTSMAAPHVTGVAALVWSVNPALSRDQVEMILFETADDLGPPGRDDQYGYGRVNAARATQRAASLPGAVWQAASGAP